VRRESLRDVQGGGESRAGRGPRGCDRGGAGRGGEREQGRQEDMGGQGERASRGGIGSEEGFARGSETQVVKEGMLELRVHTMCKWSRHHLPALVA
jgi:hypothetical protein